MVKERKGYGRRIGVYCGSFDPVHNGHIKIARECLKRDIVDEVLFVPTGDYWDKQLKCSVYDRIEMLKLAKEEGMSIDEKHNQIQYTCDLLRQLRDENDYEYKLIIGDDNLFSLDKWKDFDYLKKYKIVIIKRDHSVNEIVNEAKRINLIGYEIVDLGKIDISSSYIRNNIDDYNAVKDLLNPLVYKYIKRNNLFII